MGSSPDTTWVEHAMTALRRAGYRRGGARKAVVEALARHDCAVTALQLDEELRAGRSGVGRASVYRTLDQLEELGLVQRMEVSRGVAGYELVSPGGHHHHHAVCRGCGLIEPFEDPGLERAIERVSDRVAVNVNEHDVVLRGLCRSCGSR